MSIRFGVRAHDFGKARAEDLASRIAGSGFKFIQLAPSKAIEGVGDGPGALDSPAARSIREAFESRGITVAVLGCYVNLVRPERREYSIQKFKEYIGLTKDFGCPLVGTETFQSEEGRKGWSDEGYAALLPAVAELAAAAEAAGAWVCVEPVADHIVDSPKAMKRLIDDIRSESLKVIMDPVNLLDPSRFWERERILGESLSLLGERIEAVHAKDLVVEGGKRLIVSPGSGIFDYRPFLKKLLSAKPGLPVILEDQRPENVAGAAEYLRAGIER